MPTVFQVLWTPVYKARCLSKGMNLYLNQSIQQSCSYEAKSHSDLSSKSPLSRNYKVHFQNQSCSYMCVKGIYTSFWCFIVYLFDHYMFRPSRAIHMTIYRQQDIINQIHSCSTSPVHTVTIQPTPNHIRTRNNCHLQQQLHIAH
jgi:hypothetical protein